MKSIGANKKTKHLVLRNRQHARPIDTRLFRRIAAALLEGLSIQSFQLAVHLVGAKRMAEINRQFLAHEGSTDVITFDLREGYLDLEYGQIDLAGEIFISVEDAVAQAEQFETTWQEELVRYFVHGVLHLRGFNDATARERPVMKREENRQVQRLRASFPVHEIARAQV